MGDVVEAYFECANTEQWDRMLTLFTEDATYRTPGARPRQGREDVVAFYPKAFSAWATHQDTAHGFIFEGKYSSIARRSQDQAGDLATAVEESVHGIRVLKAFGRGKHALKNFESQAEQLRARGQVSPRRVFSMFWRRRETRSASPNASPSVSCTENTSSANPSVVVKTLASTIEPPDMAMAPANCENRPAWSGV